MALLNLPNHVLRRLAFAGVLVLVGLFVLTLVRTAWLSDDAYITYRSLDNLVNGYGPVFNVSERVQTFTHPLWMLMHVPVYALTGEIFYTGIYFSMTVSIVAVLFLLIFLGEDVFGAAIAILALTFSKAFIDYATSGLENPLTHLLIALFAWCWYRKEEGYSQLFLLALISGLALTNRMDTILFFLPALGWTWWKLRSWRSTRIVLLGLLPFLLWEVFSVIYYGFPFPNTAYAKLGTGISTLESLSQGLLYFLDSIKRDPLTLSVIAVSLGLTFWRGSKRSKWLAAGTILYLLYILRIGGDFMSGRFFTAPLFVSVILLLQLAADWKDIHRQVAVTALFLAGFLAPGNQITSPTDYGINRNGLINAHGIADERGYYYRACGLLPAWEGEAMPRHPWAYKGWKLSQGPPKVVIDDNMGMLGYFAGPKITLIDRLALTDPLLARLPVIRQENLRPGHFPRELPNGYEQTRKSGINQISDPEIAVLYDKLHHITQDPIWDLSRFKEILKMNLGYYDISSREAR